MDILKLVLIVKGKLENTDLWTDDEIILVLEEVIQTVKNYCHVYIIPDALRYTVANMSVDYLNYREKAKMLASGITGLSMDAVQSVTLDDMTVRFGTKTAMTAIHNPGLDNILLNYREQLNLFRRLA